MDTVRAVKATKEGILCEKIGRDWSHVRKRFTLLALPESIQTMVENKTLTIVPAEIIARLRQLEDRKFAEGSGYPYRDGMRRYRWFFHRRL